LYKTKNYTVLSQNISYLFSSSNTILGTHI